jgi:ferredoxin-type protein NapH
MAHPSDSPLPSGALRADVVDLRDERDGAALFRGLHALERNARRRRVYDRLAAAEERHAALAAARLLNAGVVPPPFRPSVRVRVLLAWARAFGTVSVLPHVASMEDADADAYLRRFAAEGAGLAGALHAEERANADALAEFARRESGEAAKGVVLKVRRFVLAAVGATLFAISWMLARNAQVEGLVFGLLTGVWVGPVVHYALGKLVLPLLVGRVWCGWACWTAALLDQLPYPRSAGWGPNAVRQWRTVHLAVVVVGVSVLVFGFGYGAGAVGAHAVWWFVIGNALYWLVAVGLAVALRDNRAFCKYACPVAVILKTTSRPALVKFSGDPAACAGCASHACESVCPMNLRVADVVLAGARVGGGECIACLQCVAVCPPNALVPSFGFDLGGPDRLTERPPPARAV